LSKVPLHPIEVKVLSSLRAEAVGFDSLVSSSGLSPDQVRRALSWLSSKGLVIVDEKSTTRLVKTTSEIPELALVERIRERGGSVPLNELRGSLGSDQEFSAAIGRANSMGWIRILSGKEGSTVSLSASDSSQRLGRLVELAAKGLEEREVPEECREFVPDLLKRGLMLRKTEKSVVVSLSPLGRQSISTSGAGEYIEKLTPEIIASGRWKTVNLRPIDVEAPAPTFHPGRRHPVREFIDEVREVYLSMGFTEIVGSAIQTAFWNFDALFTPQDHPARELQDTFYISDGSDRTIERRSVVSRVALTHENGWRTGSRGWRYAWSVEEARRLVLRTHNTAVTVRATAESGNRETRVFTVGKVYRNESLDYKHLAELHQMEGIIIGDGLNIRHLKGVLSKLYRRLGMTEIRLWPSFFPYTEPSMQVMTYYEKAGKWLEMGGSGIFRPEVTLPLGVTKPVLAWGCGLERLLMLRLGLTDIRELYDNDIGWLRGRPEIASSENLSR
jgi:phenylalanyl-tRNA synthetase alpha chain